jgi:hypothetical protein
LLQAAGIPGPYVLAAHSLGGLFVRLYAHTYPEEVVGLVLVDARPDGYFEQIERRLTPEQWTALLTFLVIAVVPEGSPNDPFESARRLGLEYYDTSVFNDLLREAARATPLQPMPLAVLASGRPWPGTAEDFLGVQPETLFTTWRVGQEELATILPQARFFVASESGHDIYIDQPALVTEAIRQVVAGVRHSDSWDDLVACCRPEPGTRTPPARESPTRMDPLAQLITELHDDPGPQTDEINRTARSLQDGLRRLDLLLHGLSLPDHPAGRPHRDRRRRTLQRARQLAADALRAVWQAEHA